MDRIRNARHFAPRLQRWLSEVGTLIRASSTQPDTKQANINPAQLELFAQDFYAALEPAAPPSKAAPTQEPPKAPLQPPKAPAPPSKVTLPVPTQAPDAPPLRRIQLGPHSLEFELRRSTRRSIGFMIDDNGLRVTAPRRITLSEIDHAIRAKQRWILTKLRERGERRATRQQNPPVNWNDGAQLPYLGSVITLRLVPAPRSTCTYDAQAGTLTIGVVEGLAEWQLKERVKIWYREQAQCIFTERMDMYAARLEVRYTSITLSSAGTRWGSCTVGGNIRLNWRLVHFALPLIDYVVAHELAHLKEMNHSPRFWAAVASVYPDYDGAKLALRKRSQELPVLFT